MGAFSLFLIALSLAMDAFAVSIAIGIHVREGSVKKALKVGLFFGAFQSLMPLLGYLAGTAFRKQIEFLDHWIAFLLLAVIGGKMVYDAFAGEEETQAIDPTNTRRLLVLAVATSIDALAVGISFAMVGANVWLGAAMAGAVAFGLSLLGVLAGKKLGERFQKRAMILGGLVLCGIGLKILIEHLFF